MESIIRQRGRKRHPSRVLLVAALAARRAALSRLLAGDHKHEAVEVVTASVLTRGSAVADVVLVDIDGPAMAASLLQYAAESSDAGVVALVDDPDPGWVQAALRAGVCGIISREPSSEELALALAAADARLVLLHPAAALGLAPNHLQPQDDGFEMEPLTPREHEVLRLMSDGLGNKEIAARLAISEHTAKFHISSILGKLSVASRTEAVTQGIRRGLISI